MVSAANAKSSFQTGVNTVTAGMLKSNRDAVPLQRSFRVNYATMLIRLRGEDLLSSEECDEYHHISPSSLARRLGLPYDGDTYSGHPLGSRWVATRDLS